MSAVLAQIHSFEDLIANYNEQLKGMPIEGRFAWARDIFGENVVIALSGSPKNVATATLAKNAGLRATYMNVAIADDPNLKQQQYEIEKLRVGLGLDLFTVHAATEKEKPAAVDRALKALGARALALGMMRSHMEERANLPFVQKGTGANPDVLEIFLFADQAKEDVNRRIEALYQLYPHLRHDSYAPDAQFRGGARLPEGVMKTQCALADRVVEPGGAHI
jgi:3'-phosphoadenosine 5'-phosphosulfate sulfotransferase (PAPS reductase)/FAD synthetase